MKRQLDIARVKRMIDVVDAGMAVLATMPKLDDLYEECQARERAATAILASLQNEHGATCNAGGGGYTLRLAGIQSSSTGGAGGLLRNWHNAAQRRLDTEAAASVDQGHQVQGLGDRAADQDLEALRKLHTNYVKQCGKRFAHVPFRADAVPGWVYLPLDDIVMRPPLDDVVVVVDVDRGAAR